MEVTIPNPLTADQLEWLLNRAEGEWKTDWHTDWHVESSGETPLTQLTIRHLIVFDNENDALLFVLSCL